MKRLIYLILVMVATMSLPSCKHSTVFDSYAHTPIAGWEKNDTLSFEIPPLLEGGYYNESWGSASRVIILSWDLPSSWSRTSTTTTSMCPAHARQTP